MTATLHYKTGTNSSLHAMVYMKSHTVKNTEDEVQYDAARGRRRVVDGVVAVTQCNVDRDFETAHVRFKVIQGHVPS